MRYTRRGVKTRSHANGKMSILSDVVKYVQYNQYHIGHYELEAKATEERYGTKMNKKLQDSE